ncbi:MAG: hypothetical protein DRI23_10455 [Candidatus Cloacimonadota bacterium]|nr:MAG: hypothetical protein DRI23_10455 [Candidatus Cloacimonadota bacterium]
MYNGYDEEDFKEIPKINNKNVIMRYIGNFYGHQSPKYFITALELLANKGKLPQNIKFEFIGNYHHSILNILNKSSIADKIKIIHQVSHKEAIELMIDSDGLLIFVAQHRGKNVITGKLLEYLRCQKPVFAMIPLEGEAAKILKQAGHHFIVPMEDPKLIAERFSAFIMNLEYVENEKIFTDHYSRDKQTKAFLKILEMKI